MVVILLLFTFLSACGCYMFSHILCFCPPFSCTCHSACGRYFVARRAPSIEVQEAVRACAPRVCLTTMIHIRHCLLVYVRHRMLRIEQLRWDVAGAIPTENLALLSSGELVYVQEYNHLLSQFQMKYDLDLTRGCTPPADNLLIRVNVLMDVGKFVGPESGAMLELKRGDNPYLRRGDVEHLVMQGFLKQV